MEKIDLALTNYGDNNNEEGKKSRIFSLLFQFGIILTVLSTYLFRKKREF